MDSSTLTKIPFHGKAEEMRKHIQQMDGPTQPVDLLKKQEKISQTKTSTKKSGDSSTLTRTPSHGNTEETRKHIQPTDG